MESSELDIDADASATDSVSKRKLPLPEKPDSNTLKKARYSWQVKGSKGKSVQDSPGIKCSGNSVEEPSCSNNNSEVEQPSNTGGENQFHEMDFDAPSASNFQTQRNENCEGLSFPVSETPSDSVRDITRFPTGSVNKTNRIMHVSTSLHACFLTSSPSSSGIIDTTAPLDNCPSLSVSPRRLSDPVISSTAAPTASSYSTASSDALDGIEFRDALRSMHRSNLSPYEKWQKRNTAGAIVDNVFNRTLEEMGISPDAASNRRYLERSVVENQSILAAISSQGLTVNRSEAMEASGERSGVEHDEFDYRYLRKNRDVFDKTFERLGYFRYDIRHPSNSNTEVTEANTVLPQHNIAEETGTQTNVNIAFGLSDEVKVAQNNDSHVHETVNKSEAASTGCNSELNVNLEDIALASKTSDSQENTNPDKEIKITANDLETKEKDVAVNENVLNLALSAAIQSQGLTFK